MRFSSVEALFEAPPRRSLPSNLSQLGIGRRANKKPRPIIAGQGCVGSDTKLLCMRFCCRTGSTTAPVPVQLKAPIENTNRHGVKDLPAADLAKLDQD